MAVGGRVRAALFLQQKRDGKLLFTADYTDMENLITWILSFGPKAEVLEPIEVRNVIRQIAEEIIKNYTEDTE